MRSYELQARRKKQLFKMDNIVLDPIRYGRWLMKRIWYTENVKSPILILHPHINVPVRGNMVVEVAGITLSLQLDSYIAASVEKISRK